MSALLGLIQLAVEHGASNPPARSLVHGEHHWKAVALAGLRIAEGTPGADPTFVLVFAQLHDIMRRSDGHDPEHGQRAAGMFEELCRDPGLDGWTAGSDRAEVMSYALAHHTGGTLATGEDVNVGVCWDADRINLWRVGITPDRSLLTTKAARTAEAIEYGRALCAAQLLGGLPTWPQIERRLTRKGPTTNAVNDQ
jgi:uncharacterized protein